MAKYGPGLCLECGTVPVSPAADAEGICPDCLLELEATWKKLDEYLANG